MPPVSRPTALRSQINPRSPAFAANTVRMQGLLDEVNRLQAQVIAESESKRAKFEQRNQLLPRERLARLWTGARRFWNSAAWRA